MNRTKTKGRKARPVKSIVILSILSVLVVAVAFFTFASFEIKGTVYDYNGVVNIIKLGIDLEGGVYVVLEPDKNDANYDEVNAGSSSIIKTSMDRLRARLDFKGYTEATITRQGDGIRIEIPSVDDPEEAFAVIGSTGELEFKDNDQTKTYLKSEHVKGASVGYDQDGKPQVVLNFTSEGSKRFEEATKEMTGSNIVITLDGTVISTASVSETISSNTAVITNSNWTYENYDEVNNLAMQISSGSLPIKYIQTEASTISSSLGEQALSRGLLAGGIGALLVVLFMMIVYKGLGCIADYALIIYILLLFIALAFLPWIQLTLAGIAGVILSIGMAIDANVIIFERIKEEYRAGKTVEASVKSGFAKARIAIFDSNITTLIAATVLWILGTGSVKGFAITFFVGIVLSMFTALVVTHLLIKLFMPLIKNKEKFLGLKRGMLEHAE